MQKYCSSCGVVCDVDEEVVACCKCLSGSLHKILAAVEEGKFELDVPAHIVACFCDEWKTNTALIDAALEFCSFQSAAPDVSKLVPFRRCPYCGTLLTSRIDRVLAKYADRIAEIE